MTRSPALILHESGERFLPSMDGDIRLEHLHRYHLASTLADQKDVLDIACGEGYGSNILAATARSVIGVDISTDAIAHASRVYANPRLTFRVGSCREIPLANASCDLAVSFETIEHFAEHDEFLSELERVLRPTGTLILSTPEKRNYNLYSANDNPYHVRELSGAELMHLISERFANVIAFSQMIVHGSLITPDPNSVSDPDIRKRGTTLIEGDLHENREVAPAAIATYKVIMASKSPLSLPVCGQSLFCGADIRATPAKSERDEVYMLKQSYTWRIGRFLTWPARCIARYASRSVGDL